MSTLRVGPQTHQGMLPQSPALESVPADKLRGEHETGHGRGRELAPATQHGRGETPQTGTTSAGRNRPSAQAQGQESREALPVPQRAEQPRVFVLDKRHRPLMPCHPARARKLLAKGRAVVHRLAPFTIRLKDRLLEDSEVDGVEVGIDPGSKVTGVAVFRVDEHGARHVTHLIELEHRGQRIHKRMGQRAAYRRRRRSANLRYRQPRFSNRTKPKGWLAPSLRHRVEGVEGWVARLRRWAPVTAVHVELARFDTQALVSPEISGTEYQQGTLTGFEVREYLLAKWARRCAYCDATNTPLNLDHIQPRSRGGSDRVSNLTLACVPCNEAKGNQPVAVFLAEDSARLARIMRQGKAPLRDAAAVNATRWALWRALTATGLPVHVGTGGMTKWNRTRCGVPKAHALDAACVGDPRGFAAVVGWRRATHVAASTGRGSYARTRTDAYGFPRLRLPRVKTVHGFQTGDHVHAVVPRGKHQGVHVGRVAVRTRGSFNIRTSTGLVTHVSHRCCTLLQRADGWSHFARRDDSLQAPPRPIHQSRAFRIQKDAG